MAASKEQACDWRSKIIYSSSCLSLDRFSLSPSSHGGVRCVRLACKLPLPVKNSEARPRVDLVVFIVNLLSERSLQVVESSLNHLSSDFFLGKVCFMVTDARCGALAQGRLVSVKKLAASHRCPVICAEHQTEDGISTAASRLLTILKVSAGLSPMATTALYLSTLTRCIVPSDLDED